MSEFLKSALSPKNILDKLKFQGLTVNDEGAALDRLLFTGGFRLKAFWYQWQDQNTKQFIPGTTFEQIVCDYDFDRTLRSKTFGAVEHLEIAIRATIANQLALKYGPHWFLKPPIFKSKGTTTYGALLSKIEREIGQARNRSYIRKYSEKDYDPYLVPSWMMSECVSFGFWSKAYQILRDPADKKAIGMKFDVETHEVFASWLHAMSSFRNSVAHHERLLEMQLSITPSSYKAREVNFGQDRSFFVIATVIAFLLQALKRQNAWRMDLAQLFADNSDINIARLGFPVDWQSQPGWSTQVLP